MRALELIIKKRDGQSLSPEEIGFIIKEYASGGIPDYQMASLLMAIYFQGLSAKETNALTLALANSGEVMDFSSLGKTVVDKHSSGGVGDKVTLVLTPIVAAAGVPVAKISGRGLGFTGGTIDKLESIPGFTARLTTQRFTDIVRENNLAIMAQTDSLTPAEGKLYALRDVTGTVENISLIAASIMSKKMAAGAQAILLDIKTGRGAFMESREDAFNLAEILVRIGKDMERQVVAVVSDMSQPLGYAVGNALEVIEAIKVLRGEGPWDVERLCIQLAGYMLAMVGSVRNPEEGQEQAEKLIKSGEAFEKFKQTIHAQGGQVDYLDNTSLFPQAKLIKKIKAQKAGFICEIDARRVGKVAVLLGAGRVVKNQIIRPEVGVLLNRKVGDSVVQGETLACIHGNDEESLSIACKELSNAFNICDENLEPPSLIYGVVPPFPG